MPPQPARLPPVTDPNPTENEGVLAPPPGQLDSKKKRMAMIQSLISLVIVIVIFGWLLPQVIDYQEVAAAIGGLDGWQLLALLLAGIVVFIPEGWLFSLLTPPLTLLRGISAWVASTGIANTVPAVNLVVRYGMTRSWGASVETATLAIFLSGVFDNIVKFSLPAIAVVGMAVLGVEGVPSALVWVAVIGGVVVVITVAVAIGVARSDRFTSWLGRTAEHWGNKVTRRLRRAELSGLTERIVSVRDVALGTLQHMWVRGFLASALGKLAAFGVLLLSLRLAGIPADVISDGQAFVVWTIVLLVASIPLTPGGVGFVEAAYILIFGSIAGDAYANEIAVAVVLFRTATFVLPIVLGWCIAFWWRRQTRRGRLPDPFALGE